MECPTKCFHCKRRPSMRDYKRGLQRWGYVTYRRGGTLVRRWWCEDCYEHIDAEYPKEAPG